MNTDIYFLADFFELIAVHRWLEYESKYVRGRVPKEEFLTDAIVEDISELRFIHTARWFYFGHELFSRGFLDRLKISTFTRNAEALSGADFEVWVDVASQGTPAAYLGLSFQSKLLSWSASGPEYAEITKAHVTRGLQAEVLASHAAANGSNAFHLLFNGDDLRGSNILRTEVDHAWPIGPVFGCAAAPSASVISTLGEDLTTEAQPYLESALPWAELLRFTIDQRGRRLVRLPSSDASAEGSGVMELLTSPRLPRYASREDIGVASYRDESEVPSTEPNTTIVIAFDAPKQAKS